MKKYIFENIPLTICSREEIGSYFKNIKTLAEKKIISFMNPEIFLQQEQDEYLNDYFCKTDNNFIDGVNLLYAINRVLKTKYRSNNRLTGTDFFEYLPVDTTFRVFFYGATYNNCVKAKTNIETSFSNVEIVGFVDGYTKLSDEEIINRINLSSSDILIVCLGCPKQEYWIKQNFDKINVKLLFGNGGAIDFWSGTVKRAPKYVIEAGFEWLYRLLAYPSWSRLKRQSRLIFFFFKYQIKRYRILKM